MSKRDFISKAGVKATNLKAERDRERVERIVSVVGGELHVPEKKEAFRLFRF